MLDHDHREGCTICHGRQMVAQVYGPTLVRWDEYCAALIGLTASGDPVALWRGGDNA